MKRTHRKVEDLMSTQLLTVSEDETLELVNFEMESARLRHLPVVERSRPDRLVGLITHRDLLRVAGRAFGERGPEMRDRMLRQVPVREVMRREVQTVSVSDTAATAARLMIELKIGCLPVVDERGSLVGIVTETDFVQLALDALEGKL